MTTIFMSHVCHNFKNGLINGMDFRKDVRLHAVPFAKLYPLYPAPRVMKTLEIRINKEKVDKISLENLSTYLGGQGGIRTHVTLPSN